MTVSLPSLPASFASKAKRFGLLVALLLVAFISAPTPAAAASSEAKAATGVYDIRDFGATGSDMLRDTAAIQRAIDACVTAGGGRVLVPAGKSFLIGSLRLGSHVELYLERGSVLKGSPSHKDFSATVPYPVELEPGKPVPLVGVMIFADDADDVSITGPGTIDGNGHSYVLEDLPGIYRATQERPYTVVFRNCRRVTMRDVTVREAAFWTIRLFGCDDALIEGIRIANDQKMPNNDGIDIDWSSNVRIANCHIVTGDDGISLHTSQPNGGITRPCENVVVTGCTISSRSAGLVVGADIDGIIRDVVFDNCVIKNSHRGVAVRNVMRGSVEHVLFSNMVIETRLYDLAWWGRSEPICVMAAPWTPLFQGGTIRDVRFVNLTCRGENGAVVYGCKPGLVSGIHFEGVTLFIEKTTDFDLSHQDFRPNCVEELPKIPVSGFILRNADDVTFSNCTVQWGKRRPDYYRHALDAAGCTRLQTDGLSGESADPARYPAKQVN